MNQSNIHCLDCGRPWAEMPLDTVLTREQWLLIHPDEGGLLCAACIVKRAAKLPGVINITCCITFASDYDDEKMVVHPERVHPKVASSFCPYCNEA